MKFQPPVRARRYAAGPGRRRDSAPLCPAGHLPLKGEINSFAGRTILQSRRLAKTMPQPISPLEGEMAGRPEAGAVGRRPQRPQAAAPSHPSNEPSRSLKPPISPC
ncbi:hypothetical protein EOA30_19700 [Mesorhizobium sp. M8A.F.Ca.ET.059.01.1.1]|nr:hypothetical protein EOA30_19700 [Mesorhizobium sp. M8A.F.Ca.ET.059.01.1.1]